jgi:hypothetical protein
MPLPPRADEPVDIEIIEPTGAERLGHLESGIGRGTVPPVDEIETHLHETFDHELGRIGGLPGDTSREQDIAEAGSPEDVITPWPSTAAAGLAAMLSSGEGVRQAILVHEILDRPEHRWT